MANYRWIWLATFVVCSVLVAFSKFEREVYPAVVFPSFGTPLPHGYVPPSSALWLQVFECGSEDHRLMSMSELFHRAPSSVHDRLAERLAELPTEGTQWLLGEASEIIGAPVARVEVVAQTNQGAQPNAVFEARCP